MVLQGEHGFAVSMAEVFPHGVYTVAVEQAQGRPPSGSAPGRSARPGALHQHVVPSRAGAAVTSRPHRVTCRACGWTARCATPEGARVLADSHRRARPAR